VAQGTIPHRRRLRRRRRARRARLRGDRPAWPRTSGSWRASPRTWTPRFLPSAGRHGRAPFLAFVQVDGDPPTPPSRAAPGGRQWSSERGIASEPEAAGGSAATGEGADRGWTEPRVERHEA
jgi:hypothetical protein